MIQTNEERIKILELKVEEIIKFFKDIKGELK